MTRQWTFGQKLGASFALVATLAVGIGLVAVYALRNVVAAKDRVINVETRLLADAYTLRALVEAKGGAGRAFLLTRDERFLAAVQQSRNGIFEALTRLQQNVQTDEGRQLIADIRQGEDDHQRALDQVMALRRTNTPVETVGRSFDDLVVPRRDTLDRAVIALVTLEDRRLRDAQAASTATATSATNLVVILSVILGLCAIVAAVVLTRALGRQIGAAVGQVQSSSTELQAASTQQATGAKEQATAMSEISTTISELVATSRQITESARRVAQIADDAAGRARSGEETVDQAHASVSAIRQQVDQIVGHMLELGKKSQHIGTVLEIVSELAEQTNILAINATIEAAGAGDAGRRFAVVADEIRKLADRVTESTKEIRALIDDVRSAVNTTVMATESGSKTVDAGSKAFGQVATSFKQIAALVTTTTEAAREIELSTKQQMSAVEQVNVAIANIAQASKEGEASSGQTQQTASQLAVLSKDLLRLVRGQAAA